MGRSRALLLCFAATPPLLACWEGALLGVTQTSVTKVLVTPAADTLTAIGATSQFVAVAVDQSGRVVNGITISWNSSNAAVASVNASGMATARANGQATIGASVGAATGLAVLTVAQP